MAQKRCLVSMLGKQLPSFQSFLPSLFLPRKSEAQEEEQGVKGEARWLGGGGAGPM